MNHIAGNSLCQCAFSTSRKETSFDVTNDVTRILSTAVHLSTHTLRVKITTGVALSRQALTIPFND